MSVSKGQQVKDLQRRLDILGDRVTQLEREKSELVAANTLLKAKEAQWEADKSNQNRIIGESLTKSNATSNGYLEEIERLRALLREHGVGDID